DNVLKLLIGEHAGSAQPFSGDTVILLETNIDDMDPRVYPYVLEKLMAAGARDAWLAQVLMKKGRPGMIISVLCDADVEQALCAILFGETTTLGIRRSVRERVVLERSQTKSKKIGFLPDGKKKTSMEFETAQMRARKTGAPLRTLLR
ncbi:MAG: nickel insertion protein, partial [Elusimicrobiota bacterium]